jgi:cytochrome c-type biogenesis protein CcmH/NrfF
LAVVSVYGEAVVLKSEAEGTRDEKLVTNISADLHCLPVCKNNYLQATRRCKNLSETFQTDRILEYFI